MTSAGARAARALVLSLAVFVAAFATHEVMHLAAIYAFGDQGSLLVRPWRLALLDASIPSLHAQPSTPLDTLPQALVNFLGPGLAMVPLLALLLQVREPVVRVALGANLLILAFYAVIEAGYVLLDRMAGIDLELLTTPEFNYGVPALILLVAAFSAARRPRRVVDHPARAASARQSGYSSRRRTQLWPESPSSRPFGTRSM